MRRPCGAFKCRPMRRGEARGMQPLVASQWRFFSSPSTNGMAFPPMSMALRPKSMTAWYLRIRSRPMRSCGGARSRHRDLVGRRLLQREGCSEGRHAGARRYTRALGIKSCIAPLGRAIARAPRGSRQRRCGIRSAASRDAPARRCAPPRHQPPRRGSGCRPCRGGCTFAPP